MSKLSISVYGLIAVVFLIATSIYLPANGQEINITGQEWWKNNSTNPNPVQQGTLGNIPSLCAVTESEHLVILDLSKAGCSGTNAIIHYSSLGYEIKAVETIQAQHLQHLQHLIYMQKGVGN